MAGFNAGGAASGAAAGAALGPVGAVAGGILGGLGGGLGGGGGGESAGGPVNQTLDARFGSVNYGGTQSQSTSEIPAWLPLALVGVVAAGGIIIAIRSNR